MRWIAGVAGDIRGRAAWVVFGAMMCQVGLGFAYALAAVAGPMISELGLTRAEYGQGNGPQLALQALAAPLAGWLCVRAGTRPVLLVSIVLQLVAVCGMAQIESFGGYLTCMGLLGFGLAGTGDVTVGAVAARWVERGRGLALGIVYSGANLGGALFAWLASALIEDLDWRAMLWLAAGIGGLAMFPFALFAVREPRAGEGVAPDTRPARALHAGGPSGPEVSLGAALRTRSFWLIAVALFAMFFCFVGLQRHFVLVLERAGLPSSRAVALYSAAIAIGLFTKALSGALADRMSPVRAAVATQVMTGFAALSAFTVEGDTAVVWIFVACFGLGTAARDVVYPLLLTHAFGVRSLAQIYGVQTLTLLPGGFLGPYFAGEVFDRSGGYGPALLVFAGAMFLSAVGLALVRPEGAVQPER